MNSLELRSWTVDDAEFCLTVRNHPELMRWFRQDEPLQLEQQKEFILNDKDYNGLVIIGDGERLGLCGVKNSGEFTIGLLPEYQHRGIAKWVMSCLIRKRQGIWSEVFVGNPALEWFIRLGFKIVDVAENKYLKNGKPIDTVTIFHG